METVADVLVPFRATFSEKDVDWNLAALLLKFSPVRVTAIEVLRSKSNAKSVQSVIRVEVLMKQPPAQPGPWSTITGFLPVESAILVTFKE